MSNDSDYFKTGVTRSVIYFTWSHLSSMLRDWDHNNVTRKWVLQSRCFLSSLDVRSSLWLRIRKITLATHPSPNPVRSTYMYINPVSWVSGGLVALAAAVVVQQLCYRLWGCWTIIMIISSNISCLDSSSCACYYICIIPRKSRNVRTNGTQPSTTRAWLNMRRGQWLC